MKRTHIRPAIILILGALCFEATSAYAVKYEFRERVVLFTKKDIQQASIIATTLLKNQGLVEPDEEPYPKDLEIAQNSLLEKVAASIIQMECLEQKCGSLRCTGAFKGANQIHKGNLKEGDRYHSFDFTSNRNGTDYELLVKPLPLSIPHFVGPPEQGWYLEKLTCTDEKDTSLESTVSMETAVAHAATMEGVSTQNCRAPHVDESSKSCEEKQGPNQGLAYWRNAACKLSPSFCLLLASTGKAIATSIPDVARAGIAAAAVASSAGGAKSNIPAIMGAASGAVLVIESSGVIEAFADKMDEIIEFNRSKLIPALAVGTFQELNDQERTLELLEAEYTKLYKETPSQKGYEGNRVILKNKLAETKKLIDETRNNLRLNGPQLPVNSDPIKDHLNALQQVLSMATEVRPIRPDTEKKMELFMESHGYFDTETGGELEKNKRAKLIEDSVDVLRDLDKIGKGNGTTKSPVVLLVGSPGTGKTSLVNQVFFGATGLESKVFSLAGGKAGDFIKEFEEFLLTRKTKNSAVFIDEAGDVLSALSTEDQSRLVSYFKGILGTDDPNIVSEDLSAKLRNKGGHSMGMGMAAIDDGPQDVKVSLVGVTLFFGSNHLLKDNGLNNKITKTLVMPKVSLEGRRREATKIILDALKDELEIHVLTDQDKDFIEKAIVKSYLLDDGVRTVQQVSATYANDRIAAAKPSTIGNRILNRLNKKDVVTLTVDEKYIDRLFQEAKEKQEQQARQRDQDKKRNQGEMGNWQ